MDEILENKRTTIKRCIYRIFEDYQDDFATNYTKQDAVILNIERACQAAIDMGNRIIRKREIGLPQSNRDTFVKLEKSGLISQEMSKRMQSMAGFRNMAVHDYNSLNFDIIINIIENHINDIQLFAEHIISIDK